MTEADWTELAQIARPFDLWVYVPASLREVLVNFEWDQRALHALPLPIEMVPLDALAWQLELPWWSSDRGYFSLTPNEVRRRPLQFARHMNRTIDADASLPIHAYERNGRLVLLDGVHRLLRASMDLRTHVPVQRVDRDALWAITKRA